MDMISPGDKLVFAVGGSDTGCLDQVQVVDTSKESEFIAAKGAARISESVPPSSSRPSSTSPSNLPTRGARGNR